MSARMVLCPGCREFRWSGLGPCSACGAESPEHAAETERINRARAEAGLPPLGDATFVGSAGSSPNSRGQELHPVFDLVEWPVVASALHLYACNLPDGDPARAAVFAMEDRARAAAPDQKHEPEDHHG